MKHLLMMPLCAVIMFSTACTRGDDSAMQEVPLATYAKLGEGLHNEIEPQGWLKEMLIRQDSGLTSHPEAMSYPFDSNLWVGELERDSESRGADWWRYEQTAYYVDGLIRLGYLLDDQLFPFHHRSCEMG